MISMPFRLGIITVNIPALDRLMDYVEAGQQKEIDEMAAKVKGLTEKLKQSSKKLSTAIEGE